MAGCSNCGYSCACLFVAGSNVAISGSGNAGDPFVVNAVLTETPYAATSSDNSISSVPAGVNGHSPDVTVNLSSASQVPMQNFVDGIGIGNVPIDPTTPIAASWVPGVGLRVGPLGSLPPASIPVSGVWGAGSLVFPCADTSGAPIYLDSANQIRTIPPYGTVIASEAQSTVALITGTGITNTGSSFIINNTSTCRTMVGVLTFGIGHAIQPSNGGAQNFAVAEEVDSGAGFTTATFCQTLGNNQALWAWTHQPRTLTLAPGGSQNVQRRINVSAFAGGIGNQAFIRIGAKTFMGSLT